VSEGPKESPRLHKYRARLGSLWIVSALEALAISALFFGASWFAEHYKQGGTALRMLTDPALWLVVLIASLLGALGNLALYYLGQRGTEAVLQRFPRIEGRRWKRIGTFYQRFGAKLLILSAIPGLGSLLTTGAGAFGIKRNAFLFWVILAKGMRNWVLLLLFHQVYWLLKW
jgi:membrane protein YqaA with SNARE-associated domain